MKNEHVIALFVKECNFKSEFDSLLVFINAPG